MSGDSRLEDLNAKRITGIGIVDNGRAILSKCYRHTIDHIIVHLIHGSPSSVDLRSGRV